MYNYIAAVHAELTWRRSVSHVSFVKVESRSCCQVVLIAASDGQYSFEVRLWRLDIKRENISAGLTGDFWGNWDIKCFT